MSKTALVTGASAGIGTAIAKRLAADGYQLVLLARREHQLQELAAEVAVPCHLIKADLAELGQLEAQLQSLPPAFARIDTLINNAGLALGLEPAQRADWQDWQQMIQVNCTALAFLTHQILPGMVQRQSGHIINIGSTAGSYAYKGGNVYGATKAFVEQFSRNLKADLLGTPVRVTNIEPGMVAGSEFSLVRFKGDTAKVATTYANADALQPEDIANAVAWALNQPAHVNICRMEIMPVCQAPERMAIHRNSDSN